MNETCAFIITHVTSNDEAFEELGIGDVDPRYMFKSVWDYNHYSSATIIDLF